MPKDVDRQQINIRLERELYNFLVKYAQQNYKTVTAILREIIADLYKENQVPLVIKKDEE